MIRGLAVLRGALLLATCSTACEPSDRDDAHSMMDAHVQTRDARADASCPPECFRAYTCATSCGAPTFNNGCCPCPAGTIDTITCN